MELAARTEELREGLPLFWFTPENFFPPRDPASIFSQIWETAEQPGVLQSLLP